MVGAATAAAAAIGLLIYAYNKGSKEADAYNNALILTGNYAGTTAADLGSMAKRVGSSTTTVADADFYRQALKSHPARKAAVDRKSVV